MSDNRDEYIKKLEQVSSLTREEARKLLMVEMQQDAKAETARIIRESEDEAKLIAHKKAQEILVDAMRHGALDIIPEYTISVVKIQDEDVKGKITRETSRDMGNMLLNHCRFFVAGKPFDFENSPCVIA